MYRPIIAISLLLLACTGLAAEAGPAPLSSPGLPTGCMDAQGRLVEDWGTVGVRLVGQGLSDAPAAVKAVQLDGVVPAAQYTADRGAVRLAVTAFRAPAFPSGVDVLCVRVEETKGQPARVTVVLDLPAQAKRSLGGAAIEERVVLSVPRETLLTQELRPWGYTNDTGALPRWARPEGKCDPAFANIRVGMGGRPIRYSFQVAPGSRPHVVLGLCESHWALPRKRPLICRVEGAPPQEIDPVAQWGQHKPGALLFRAHDADRDGRLEVSVNPVAGAPDRNTILNALWVFPPGKAPDPAKVITGELNKQAACYVDAGGPGDQSIYPSTNLEFPLVLPAGGVKELAFWAACPHSAAPIPDQTAWTPQTLRQAAVQVLREWSGR